MFGKRVSQAKKSENDNKPNQSESCVLRVVLSDHKKTIEFVLGINIRLKQTL